MRTAIIGLGVICKVHMGEMLECSNVFAICDIDESKRALYPDLPFYTDYKVMLDEVKPDVVHIATPHYLHAEMAVYALDRNINVLCEKPLAINEEQLGAILTAEKNSKAILGVCQQNRFNPNNAFVKEYLKDKKSVVGVGIVPWNRDKAYYDSAEWRGKWATEGGGVLINQALHTLDLLIWYCGAPTSQISTIDTISLSEVIEVEDTAVISAKTEKGGFTFFATNSTPKNMPVEITLNADGNTVKLLPDMAIINGEVTRFESKKALGKVCYGSSHAVLIREFYNSVSRGEKFSISGVDGATVVRSILSCYKK